MTEEVVPVNTFDEVSEKEAEKVPTADDEVLSLYHTPGWKRVVEFVDTIIEQRKAKTGLKDGELPETYGARRLADDEAIKELEKVKNYVESIAKYREEQRGKEDSE